MLDKRTLCSQNYKILQLQQYQKLSPLCKVLPPDQFDFTLADPEFGNRYERLKVTYLFLCSTQSPVSSTLLNILQQFEQLAAHTTSTVAKYAVQSVNSSMTESIPSDQQSQDCTLSNILTSPSDSAIFPADSNCDAATISSLFERYADQLEVHCSLLEQISSSRPKFTS